MPLRPPVTQIHLARHGETDDNARLVFQGQGGRGLNARGRAQARRLAERMLEAKLSAIVSSDLERAVETARIVGSAIGMEPTIDPELREVDIGVWSGKDHETIARLYPEEWTAWSRGVDVPRGGGETYAELAARVERAVTRAYEMASDGPVLVVSHGGAIKSYVASVLGIQDARRASLAGVGNTSLTTLRRTDVGLVQLVGWNDMAHLEASSSTRPWIEAPRRASSSPPGGWKAAQRCRSSSPVDLKRRAGHRRRRPVDEGSAALRSRRRAAQAIVHREPALVAARRSLDDDDVDAGVVARVERREELPAVADRIGGQHVEHEARGHGGLGGLAARHQRGGGAVRPTRQRLVLGVVLRVDQDDARARRVVPRVHPG